MDDKLVIGGHEFHSRFILGSGKYSLKLIEAAVRDAGAEIITLAVRRANTKEQENICLLYTSTRTADWTCSRMAWQRSSIFCGWDCCIWDLCGFLKRGIY